MLASVRGRLAGVVLCLALIASLVLMPAVASATPLAPAPTPVVAGTDMVVAGLGGLIEVNSGSLAVSGIGSGTVTRAWLYWSGPTSSPDPNVNATITFQGSTITGTNIGVDSSNCRGVLNSQAYRADVTSLVSGDGTYTIAGTTKANPIALATGASLIVFFNDGNANNNRDVYIYEGNDSNTDDTIMQTWDASLSGIQYDGAGAAELTLHVSDGQSGVDDGNFALNGTTFASGIGIFDGASVPLAAGAFQSLWDIKSWDATAHLTPGDNTLLLTHSGVMDCLSLIVATVSVPSVAPSEDVLFADLRTMITDLDLAATTERSMLAQLSMAEALSPSRLACTQLTALDLNVRSQESRRRISPADAAEIYAQTQQLRAVIGCGADQR